MLRIVIFRKLTETEQFFEDVSKFYNAQLIDEAKKTQNIKKRAEESKEDTKPQKEEDDVDHMDIEESETTQQHKAEIPFEKMDHNLK